MAMRVGIFDPTADPPHLGHLMVMEMTRISLGLDRMVITSPGDHVTKRYLTRAEDRLAMLKVLIPERLKAYYEFVDELALEGGYFTHKLTDEAARRYPDATRYYLLGSDNLISFAGWGNHNEIIARTKLAVIPRAGSNLFDLMEEEPGDQHARHPVSPDMSLADAKAWIRAHYFNHRTGEHDIVVVQPAVRMDISSSFIRQALERGDDVSFILTEPVQAYIDAHKLYRRRGRQTRQEGAADQAGGGGRMTSKSMQERANRERAYAAANRRRALINSLSGGVDSTLSGLVSKLAESESGELRALGVDIPISRDPAREADLVDAKRVAAQLGMPLTVVNLTEVWETVAGLLGDAARDLAAQSGTALAPERLQWAVNNLKPTLRMMAAGFLADAFDGLMVGTDNVIENFLGYFSIRGDGIADRQPLRDMTKGEVYRALAEAGFPEDLAYRTPTPGLFDFQNHTDEGELGFLYAEADAFVEWILREEALRAREAGRLACVFLDETVTLREGWAFVAVSSPCPVPAEVAAKIARQNRKTFFKRKPTDLAWTLRERGLFA